MSGDQQRYLCYLLRVWTVDRNGTWTWRASLESSTTGERLGFPDLDALFAFLRQCTSTMAESNGRSAASASLPSTGDPH